jgi:hypothetical protein
MIFIILFLCSFVALHDAIPFTLQPMLKHSNTSETSNLMQQILKHTNDTQSDKFLINLVNELDPAQVQNVIVLVQALLDSSRGDLDRLILGCTDAGNALDSAVAAHTDALLAQTEGVAASELILADGTAAAQNLFDQTVGSLQADHQQIVAQLQAAVDSALSDKNAATNAKSVADGMLNSEQGRLESEIQSLSQVISILQSVSEANGISVPQNGLYSWFKPSGAHAVWSSSVGNFVGAATGSPVTVTTEAGNGATIPITYLSGPRTSIYHFGHIIPATFTICSTTRYTAGAPQGRILTGRIHNWLHGQWNSNVGVAHYGAWQTNHARGMSTDWIVMCCSSDPGQSCYVNGNEVHNAGGARTGDEDIWVNYHTAELSDWGVAEIITWDRALTNNEIQEVGAAMMSELH